jgi:hypothetical protein
MRKDQMRKDQHEISAKGTPHSRKAYALGNKRFKRQPGRPKSSEPGRATNRGKKARASTKSSRLESLTGKKTAGTPQTRTSPVRTRSSFDPISAEVESAIYLKDIWRELQATIESGPGAGNILSGWLGHFFWAFYPGQPATQSIEVMNQLSPLTNSERESVAKQLECPPEEIDRRLLQMEQEALIAYVEEYRQVIETETPKKMREAIRELLSEVERRCEKHLKDRQWITPSGNLVTYKGPSEENRKQLINDTLHMSDKARKTRMLAPRPGGSTPQFDHAVFKKSYPKVYPKWRDARKIYVQNKNRKWVDMIKINHPDLPPDLVVRIPHLSPSHLALENAARLAGVAAERHPASFTPAYLFRVLRSKKS